MDVGIVGKTYKIIERDLSEEIKEKAKLINWKDIIAKSGIEKKVRNFKPQSLQLLPRAVQNRSRLVSMDYTLETDIKDAEGEIIYPKGFTFNPLDYRPYSKTMVVLNGADPDQVVWFRTSPYFKNPNVLIMITDGSYSELSGEFSNSVYFLDEKIVKRLQLQFVPSVIAQKNNMMEVTEIEVKHIE